MIVKMGRILAVFVNCRGMCDEFEGKDGLPQCISAVLDMNLFCKYAMDAYSRDRA
jgi:hypothetical protein